MKAESVVEVGRLPGVPEASEEACSCSGHNGGSELDNAVHYFRCPTVVSIETPDQKHFQQYLYKGEPVIVPNMLNITTGLSWEPLVMWRASRKIRRTNDFRILDFAVTNCLNWCERKRSDSKNCHQCHRNDKEIVVQHQVQAEELLNSLLVVYLAKI